MLKDMDFYHLGENIENIDALKTTSKKVVHKAAEATSQFLRIKIADQFVKPKHVIDENPRNVEEIIIPSEKR